MYQDPTDSVPGHMGIVGNETAEQLGLLISAHRT